jgi:hypothetical protein
MVVVRAVTRSGINGSEAVSAQASIGAAACFVTRPGCCANEKRALHILAVLALVVWITFWLRSSISLLLPYSRKQHIT